jgi:PLD-like domain/Helix-hairpin-helix motif
MQYVDSSDLITAEVIDVLRSAAGVAADSDLDGMELSLARIFDATGGFPIFDDFAFTESQRTRRALELLREATLHAFAATPLTIPPRGFVLRDEPSERFEQEIVPIRRVAVNSAPHSELEALPVIGSVIADQIIAERVSEGPFASLDDFATRLTALGEEAKAQLRDALRFDHPDDEWRYSLPSTGDLEQIFGLFVQLSPGADAEARLRSALDRLATSSSGQPHPATADRRRRPLVDESLLDLAEAEWAGMLIGSEYFREVLDMLLASIETIDVCMFHIALPEENHPTRQLLEALVSAQGKGVSVRVLVDRDRADDPFHSTVINSPAKAFLDVQGVPCRFDEESILLHSKYLVIDESVVVIGSHNWSAGSFFQFDDVSLAVGSSEYARVMTQRFEESWDAADRNGNQSDGPSPNERPL